MTFTSNPPSGDGTSGLAARAARLGMVLPTPEVNPADSASQAQLGTHDLLDPDATPDAAASGVEPGEHAPANESSPSPSLAGDDLLAKIGAFMDPEATTHVGPGHANHPVVPGVPVDPDPSTDVDEEVGGQSAGDAVHPRPDGAGDPPASPAEPSSASSALPAGPPTRMPWEVDPADAPAASAPTPAIAATIGGVGYTEQELAWAIQAAQTQAMMTPEQVQLVNAVLRGEAQVVAPGGPGSPGAPTHSPAPSSAGDPFAELDEFSPGLRAQFEQQQATLQQQGSQLRQMQMEEAKRQQAAEEAVVQGALVAVCEKYGIDPARAEELAGVSGPFAHYVFSQAPEAALAGDRSPLYTWAFEQAVYATPAFRDAIIATEVQSKVDDILTSDELTAARRRREKAGSLAGSPQGSAPRTAPPARDARTLTEAEIRTQMADQLRATMNQ